jgi:hypothetical protein
LVPAARTGLAVGLGTLFSGRDHLRRSLHPPRHVQYYLDHKFTVEDSEFFPSAHALADPLPIPGNKIELLHNGK